MSLAVSITCIPSLLAHTSQQHVLTLVGLRVQTYASVTANGTKVNVYNQRATALANVSSGATAPAGGVTPNHDTLYAQAVLDLSQVSTQIQADLAGQHWGFLDSSPVGLDQWRPTWAKPAGSCLPAMTYSAFECFKAVLLCALLLMQGLPYLKQRWLPKLAFPMSPSADKQLCL